jgi:ABC-type phosphate transport system substrate-binding protein
MTSLTGCSSGAKSAAGGDLSTTPSRTPGKSTPCATGSLHLIGSTAFLPIAQDAAIAYSRGCPGASINVTDGDSAYGLAQVRQAVAANSPGAGSMIAMYDGFPADTAGLKAYPMGVLIFSVVAHTGLFAAFNITTEELQKIFVKPGEQGKVAVGRRSGSGSRQAFDRNILGIPPGSPDKGNCPTPTGRTVSFTSCTEDSTADLLDFVNGTPNAIGYAEISKPHAGYPQISVLSIDHIAPTTDNVANGSYKFWTVEHLYAAANPTALTLDFLDFLSHYKGPNLPPDFIPCADAVKTLGAAC